MLFGFYVLIQINVWCLIFSLKNFLYYLLKCESTSKKNLFLFTWECLHFTFILEDSFARYKMIGWQPFCHFLLALSFSPLNMTFYHLPAPLFLLEVSCESYWDALEHDESFSSLLLLSRFCLCVFLSAFSLWCIRVDPFFLNSS